jgi:hypothetical protein
MIGRRNREQHTLAQAEFDVEFIEKICHVLDGFGNRHFLYLLAEET